MSAVRSWIIRCDGCGYTIDNGDLRNETAAEGRAQAKARGAHINLPGGRDICKDCWEEGKP